MYLYDEVVLSIIRPPRQLYRMGRLGPKSFVVHSKVRSSEVYHIEREDTVVTNKQNSKLYLSCYWIKELPRAPVTIYLHANNGSRNEGLQYINPLLENGIAVVLFDSSGSGMSEGEYITLGIQQAQDLQSIIQFIVTQRNVKQIALWGRSMGAVAALIFAANTHRQIRACIYDSPFCSLKRLIREMGKKKTGIPEFMFSFLLPGINDRLKEKANIGFQDFNLKEMVQDIRVPGFFITSQKDNLVQKHHSQKLHKLYRVEKYIEYVDCEHNEPRPKYLIAKCVDFLKLKFKLKRPTGLNLLQIKYPNGQSRLRKSIKIERSNPRTQMSEEGDPQNQIDEALQKQKQVNSRDCLFHSMCSRDDRLQKQPLSKFSKKMNVLGPTKPTQSHEPSPFRQPVQPKNPPQNPNQASRLKIFEKKVFQGTQSQKSGLQQSFSSHNLVNLQSSINLTQSQPRFSIMTSSFHQRGLMSTRFTK